MKSKTAMRFSARQNNQSVANSKCNCEICTCDQCTCGSTCQCNHCKTSITD